jgi:hypothetical protein
MSLQRTIQRHMLRNHINKKNRKETRHFKLELFKSLWWKFNVKRYGFKVALAHKLHSDYV